MTVQPKAQGPGSPGAAPTKRAPSVTFIRPGGEREQIEVEIGSSVMDAAVCNGIDEIVAECGGSLTCATCHVYVEDGIERAPERSADEEEMLECAASPRADNSRLSCQLVMTPEMDGLVVRLPETQL
jgi:2Fe-2S ferredoxin